MLTLIVPHTFCQAKNILSNNNVLYSGDIESNKYARYA